MKFQKLVENPNNFEVQNLVWEKEGGGGEG